MELERFVSNGQVVILNSNGTTTTWYGTIPGGLAFAAGVPNASPAGWDACRSAGVPVGAETSRRSRRSNGRRA